MVYLWNGKYPAVEGQEELTRAVTWISPGNILGNERSQVTKAHRLCDSIIRNVQSLQIYRYRKHISGYQGLGGEEERRFP